MIDFDPQSIYLKKSRFFTISSRAMDSLGRRTNAGVSSFVSLIMCFKLLLSNIIISKCFATKLFLLIYFMSNTIMCYQEPPRIISLAPRDITILAKGDAIIECKIVSFPVAQISWYKNEKKLNKHNRKFLIINGPNLSYLRIRDASYSWSRTLNITCKAENSLGFDQSSALLKTVSESSNFPVIKITNPKSVEPHSPFMIECNVSSQFQPISVAWYQSNQLINLSQQKYRTNWFHINESYIRHVLYIDGFPLASIRESQEIDFMCGATSSHGTQFAGTSILLRNRLMPPIFLSPKRSVIELEYGSSINVTCHANGMPRPRVKWRQVKPETPINLNVATIYYNSIELEWNPGGMSDVLTYNVKYREYKNPKIDTEIFSTDLDESNIEKNYKIIEHNENSFATNDEFISINTSNTRFKVANTLKPYHFYEFKIAAVNRLGVSDESNTIRVRTAATKPGLVKNIRYTYMGDSAFLIRCDEPDETNGKLISFRIYYTDQATKPIGKWHSVYVPLNEMPYKLNLYKMGKRLKRYFDEYSRYDQFHFMRISAVNAELGEGPYSSIIELRNIQKRFEAPFGFKTIKVENIEKVGTNHISLKWSIDLDVLRTVNKQLNFQQKNYYHTDTSNIGDRISEQDQAILKNVYFELYLISQQPNKPSLSSKTLQLRRLIKPFRTISAIDLLSQSKLKRSFNDESKEADREFVTFEYNLTMLRADSLYIMEMSTRLYNLESYLTEPLKFLTLREYLIF